MFTKRHLISTREFSKEEIDYILSRAEELEVYARGNGKEGKGRKSDSLKGKILANLFYEPNLFIAVSNENRVLVLGS